MHYLYSLTAAKQSSNAFNSCDFTVFDQGANWHMLWPNTSKLKYLYFCTLCHMPS